MKCLALLLGAALVAQVSVAQAGSPHSLGMNVGLAMPTGDVSDVVGAGYVVGGTYEYRAHPAWSVGATVDYFALGEKSTSSTILGSTRTVKVKAPGGQAIVFGRYYFPMQGTPVAPYVSFAIEKTRIGFKSTVTYRGSSVSSEDKQDKPGFGIGLGATRKLDDRITGGVDFAFHQIQTDNEATHLLTLTIGVTFGLGN